MNKETKAENLHVSPADGKPFVSGSCRHDYGYKIEYDHTAVAVCSKCKKKVKA